ncbi:MAG: hypothetical protein JWM03_895 [Rhodocyclales bacterium]|nr:hypothetical protein [Rhodocyclales bacterium]
MNLALLVSALMLGLASGGHCIAMCGVGSSMCLGGQARPTSAHSHIERLRSFHAGRIFGYAFVGALLGGAAEAFHALTQWLVVLRPLWTMANAALFLFGLTLLITARQPLLLSAAGQKLGNWFKGGNAFETVQPVAFYSAASAALSAAPKPAPSRVAQGGLALGLSWAFIPCGPLYSAWTLALFAGDAFSGALTAAIFAVASGAQLGLAQWWLGRRGAALRSATGSRWDRFGMRVAGGALCLSAGYSIAMLIAGGRTGGLFCL